MRRHWESMNNDKKKSVAIGRALLSGPYLIWMIGFTIIPLALIFWYGITTKNGNLTLANITAIMSPDHWKALWLSLGLSLISTVLCLVLAYPLAMILRGRGSSASGFIVFIFILPMWMNFLLRTMAWQTLLERNGVINGILAWLHLPKQNLINTPAAIVLGMVYNYLPFMILPHFCRRTAATCAFSIADGPGNIFLSGAVLRERSAPVGFSVCGGPFLH